VSIPTLTTDWLLLRAFRDDDLDAYADVRGPGGHALPGLHRMMTCTA
jgi:hypothetical protein